MNHSPSFNTDSELDREIKSALIYDTLQLINFGACDRRKCIEEERRRIKDRLLGKSNRKESRYKFKSLLSLGKNERQQSPNVQSVRKPFCDQTLHWALFFHEDLGPVVQN